MADTRPPHFYQYTIDAFGQWFCEENPVTDPELVRFLSRSIDGENGGYFIRCEGEVHPVHVVDAPLWIHCVHLTTEPDGSLRQVEIELEDGRREPLNAESLTVVHGEALYCRATSRSLKARFGKLAYYELTRHLQMDPDEKGFFFVIDGRRFNIREEHRSSSI